MDDDSKRGSQSAPASECSQSQAFLDTHKHIASALKEAHAGLCAPLAPAEAKEIVDDLVQNGGHLRRLGQKDFAYGIPTTPEEFFNYSNRNKEYPKISSKIGTSPERYADQVIHTLRQYHMPVITELHERGINSDDYWHSVTDQFIKPANFNINELSNKLTEREKEFVKFRVAVAQFLEEKGLLVSSEKDAPKNSSWANRVRESLAEETTTALAHLR